MQEELLTQSELGAFFKMGKDGKSARRLCEKHGVYPLNIGSGKIPRLRWLLSDVRQILTTLKQAKSTEPRTKLIARKKGEPSILGRKKAELFQEVSAFQ